MSAKRKFASEPASSKVISLTAYRETRARETPAPAELPSAPGEVGLYWRWLAVTGALWTFWW
jgi:hypothetical protein